MVYLRSNFVQKGVAFVMVIILFNFFRLHISDEQLKRRMLMAVPKKGRLYDQCIRLLERAGIKVTIRVVSTNLLHMLRDLLAFSAGMHLVFPVRKNFFN